MKKQILPLLALRGKMVYPDTSVYFEVSRPKSMAALEQAVNHEQQIFLVNQIDPSIDKPDQEDLYTVGTIAKILQMVKAGQGVLRVFVEGQTRARISSYTEVDGCVKVEVEELPDTGYPPRSIHSYHKIVMWKRKPFSECLKKERKNFPRKIRDFLLHSFRRLSMKEIYVHL